MIFSSRSTRMLKYEKAKSKLVEFEISEENYPHFQLNPDDLTYTTFYALSRYCEEYIDDQNSPQTEELFDELLIVSQYYDSTVKTGARQNHSKQLLLLGATAYFLSENFGSAKVLIEQLEGWVPKNTVMTLLYVTLNFLLTGKWVDVPTKSILRKRYLSGLKNHFNDGESPESIHHTLQKLRSRIYQSTSVSAVNYIDLLYAVAICALHHSAWMLLPEYSNFEVANWKDYLSASDSVKLLWPAQKVIIQAGALTGSNLVVPLPTGVGKTKSIEILLRSKFMDKGACIAVIIAPLRALCNEITADLTSALSNEVVINQFTDTNQEDFDLESLFNTKSVFICTPEKFSYILRHEPDFLRAIQLFVFDEAHLFDDASRGTQYELLVSEIVRSKNETAQMILFSAVLSNADQISDWLFGDKASAIDHSLVKSTDKSIGFLSSDHTIHYYEKDSMAEESFFVPKSIKASQLQLRGKETKPRIFPENKKQDLSIYFANKLCPQGGVAIYAGLVRSIPPIMRRIVEISDRSFDLSNLLANGDHKEIAKLSSLLSQHYGKDAELTQASKLGAFPHYSDLPNGLKMAIEHALRKKHIHFIVCTTTLAEGVNIPIKYLLLSTFSYGNTNVQIRKMQNMVGRTARSGIHTEGSAIVTDFSLYDNRTGGRGWYKWNDSKKMFDYGNTEACVSAILALVSNLYLDYENFFKADSLIAYLVNNYNNSSCFTDLINNLKTSYEGYIDNSGMFDRYGSEIDEKVNQIKSVFESVENYLCYIYNAQQESGNFFDAVKTLATQTFAYYLGSEQQKSALATLFDLMAHKITSEIKPENAAYFAKSLYGIDLSKKVFEWVDANIEMLSDCSDDQRLTAIIDLYVSMFSERIKISTEDLKTITSLWINGDTYISIFKKLHDTIKIDQIEKLCSRTISYHICFLIGNILDALDDRAEELSESLAYLQKRLKYGIPNRFQMLICENVIDDRCIAKLLDDSFGNMAVSDKTLKAHIKSNRREILKMLKDYPDYFSYRVRAYTR